MQLARRLASRKWTRVLVRRGKHDPFECQRHLLILSRQSGTYRPIKNTYSWVNLTNMVWIDQPIGTGFSPAAPGAPAKIVDEHDVARDFMGFWKNFMETFDLVGKKVYITGGKRRRWRSCSRCLLICAVRVLCWPIHPVHRILYAGDEQHRLL